MNDDKKRLLFLISVKLLEIIFFVSLNYFIIEKKKKKDSFYWKTPS